MKDYEEANGNEKKVAREGRKKIKRAPKTQRI